VLELMDQRGLDPARATPGRGVVRMIGESLVEAMELARQKDSAKGDERNALGAAYGQVEEQEDEHLFHSSGWCRELWIESPPSPASTWTPTRAWSRSTAPCRPRP